MDKIKKSYYSTKSYIPKVKYFGLVAIKIYLFDLLAIWFDDKFNLYKYKVIEDYLESKYNSFSNEKNIHNNDLSLKDKTIWIFWWQGESTMPEICKICYHSLLKHSKKYKVVMVTQNNLNDYIQIPRKIMQKVEKGSLSFTNFSDIVRCMLLARYGGLWVDSTMFFVQDIPEEWFDYPFFSIKNKPDGFKFVSQNRWSTFIMGSNGTCNYFKELAQLMIKYAKKEQVFLEYMTIDYFMDILFRCSKYKLYIDMLPVQNEDLHVLRQLLNKEMNTDVYNTLVHNNVCFKLSYKLDLREFVNGSSTFYKFLKDEK